MTTPMVSIIIPTRNRRAALQQTLIGLIAQTIPPTALEVLVVTDGSSDESGAMVCALQVPYTLRLIEQPTLGLPTARNRGAAEARAPLLIFFDDDIIASPGFVAAHMQAQQEPGDRVVLGPYLLNFHGKPSLYQINLRIWWSDKFFAMSLPGHRFTFEDLSGGNFSITAELYARLGGFDPIFKGYGGKDYEFGARILKAGARLTYAADALGDHRDPAGFGIDRLLRRTRDEARNDVILGRLHPELRPALRIDSIFNASVTGRSRLLQRLAIGWPNIGDRLALILQSWAAGYEQRLFRAHWWRLTNALRMYWYIRGVVEELGNQQAVTDFVTAGREADRNRPLKSIPLELSEGLATCTQRLDQELPDRVELYYQQSLVGHIPAPPGAEPLRGVHLAEALRQWPITQSLAHGLATTIHPPLATWIGSSGMVLHTD